MFCPVVLQKWLILTRFLEKACSMRTKITLIALLISCGVAAQVFTTPPAQPVRSMAEWEELQALVVTWNGHAAILANIIRAARTECRVIVCCNSAFTVNSAQNYLSSQGVDISSNVEFVIVPNNSVWVRDYGPQCVYANGVDSLMLVDWIYNRHDRENDNEVPVKLGEYLQLPVFSTTQAPYDLVNTGGNYMSDGMGTAFASKLILTNNDTTKNAECSSNPDDLFGQSNHSESAIDNIAQEYMGIDRYVKFDPLPYDCIHHIDMHMKLLDEHTLLVGEYPPGTADGPQIEANIQYLLAQFQTSFGTPFRVVRIPMPPHNGNYPPSPGAHYRTYANATFVNKTIIVPFYEQQFDTIAQRIWEEAMPGYRIVGVNCNSIIPLRGAIHCITREIGVQAPLRIVHLPLEGVVQNSAGPANYPVTALIQHRDGIADARVFYRQKNQPQWESVAMQPVGTPDSADYWTGLIPKQEGYYDSLYYYIEAVANNGKTQQRPLPGPLGAWRFYIQPNISSTIEAPARLMDIFPNPASAITVVPVESPVKTRGAITLHNSLGQVVLVLHDGEIPAGSARYFFDAGALPPGPYFVQMRSGARISTKKVVIK
jgi:agmatine/peptidylarginine deiminase